MMRMVVLDSIRIIARRADQGRNSFTYFIIFSLPYIYMQIRRGVTLAWSSGNTTANVASTMPSTT
jgi:hypothetical protein